MNPPRLTHAPAAMIPGPDHRPTAVDPPLRWGFVGTGAIAERMAGTLAAAPSATLTAVASRRLETAQRFADRHGAAHAFSDWREMFQSAPVDALYIAIPTGLREAIAVAAADAGRHVLCEKPFISLSSLQRITRACRQAGVAFMDATHFVHHPRHRAILERLAGDVGSPRVLRTSFLLNLPDRGDIRYDPSLEPLGAIGDLGWYNLRATLEYLAPDALPSEVQATLQRDEPTGAIVHAEGVLQFDDGAESDWRCGFTSPSADLGLELEGPRGRVRMDNFVGDDGGLVGYHYRAGGDTSAEERTIPVEAPRSAAAQMFEDFARAAREPESREHWMRASERTQALVDQVLDAAAFTPDR